MNQAIILDRDGTINEEMGYINHISRFKIFDFVFPALRLLNQVGYKIIVITNQSGIARGYFTEQLLKEVHAEMIQSIEKNDAHIDGIYYCPHYKDGIVKEYKKICECRKPKPGLLRQAQRDFNLDLNNSFMIGDRYKDVEFGLKNGLKTIMVMTGYGLGEYTYQRSGWENEPHNVCKNIYEAAQIISNLKHSSIT